MIALRTTRLLRGAATLALAISFPLVCAGQGGATSHTNVFSNPRAPMSDPRVGLKAGLYDAAEAASGRERIASMPKPPGFAPGNAFAASEPPVDPSAADDKLPPRAPAGQYGST